MTKKVNKKEAVKNIAIPELSIERITIEVVGQSPLLVEKMDPEVAIRYDKKKAKKNYKEDTRSEEDKVPGKIYYTEDGNIGFPASGFLGGMLEVSPRINGKSNFPFKIDITQGIRFVDEIVPIDFKEQSVATHYGRQSGMTKAPRLIMRPRFRGWKAKLSIEYNTMIFSAEQVVNLVNWAGFHCGIGGYRRGKSGPFGQYKVKVSK